MRLSIVLLFLKTCSKYGNSHKTTENGFDLTYEKIKHKHIYFHLNKNELYFYNMGNDYFVTFYYTFFKKQTCLQVTSTTTVKACYLYLEKN